MTSNHGPEGLNIKYALEYSRVRNSLARNAEYTILKTAASDQIGYEVYDEHLEHMPTLLHLEESVNSNRAQSTSRELDGAIWFVALLTRVDGLVLLNSDLDVRGFGVEITLQGPPERVFLARSSRPSDEALIELDYNHFGTRHRSMMRYCWANPDSIGFVVSQDGDIRVMTRIGANLLVWDNIQLHYEAFSPPRKSKRKSG